MEFETSVQECIYPSTGKFDDKVIKKEKEKRKSLFFFLKKEKKQDKKSKIEKKKIFSFSFFQTFFCTQKWKIFSFLVFF